MAKAKEKIKVSIIILSWNTKTLLRQCLRSLDSQLQFQNSKLEVVVIDNGSTDGSPEMVKKWKMENGKWRIKLIKNKKNLGFGKGNNQGMKIAKGDYFLLLNSDTVVKGQAPLAMARFLEDHPGVGAVGCKLLNPDGTDQPSAGRFPDLWVTALMLFAERWLGGRFVRTSYHQIKEVDWVAGAALMIRRAVLDTAGPMDEGIFMYMDEVEWCYRIKKAGYKVMFYPEAKIVHLSGGSSKTGRKDPILNIYRGLIYFYKKHYPHWQLPLLHLMLKLKALIALFIGYLTNNNYLKETYGEAIKIS